MKMCRQCSLYIFYVVCHIADEKYYHSYNLLITFLLITSLCVMLVAKTLKLKNYFVEYFNICYVYFIIFQHFFFFVVCSVEFFSEILYFSVQKYYIYFKFRQFSEYLSVVKKLQTSEHCLKSI
ncbi:Protein of unknown function [Gryllus bimaculatus]|nr:Protein of unknown function [Gryllus bimaculatus]